MSDALRVLHCTVRLNRGGYETLLMNLLREMAPKGIFFDFISSFPGEYDEEARALGSHIYRIPFITKVGPFAYASALRKVLRSQQPRILHAHMDKFCGMAVREAAKVGVPVRIAHAHSTKNEGNLAYHLVKNYYGRLILPYATDLFACSSAAAEWMYGEAADRAQIVYNGIDLRSFPAPKGTREAMRAELGLENCFVVGHVGRFTPPKNHRFLLTLFKEICGQVDNAHLLLAGDGPLREEMQALVMRENLADRVHFLGVRSDIPRVFSAMDVFVFPSLYEGLGMSLVEAQAAGLPCVCSTEVPPEAVVSGSVCQLGLNEPLGAWVDAVFQPRFFAEPGASLEKYDIDAVAEALGQFYRSK